MPITTLRRKLKNNENKIREPGPSPGIDKNDQTKIIFWIKQCAERGMPRTVRQIQFAIKDLLRSPFYIDRPNFFKNELPSKRWVLNLVAKHNLRCRKPEALSKASAEIQSVDLIRWWAIIDKYFVDKNLKEIMFNSSRIWNMDETYLDYNPHATSVVVPPNSQSYQTAKAGNKAHCTIAHTVSIYCEQIYFLLINFFCRCLQMEIVFIRLLCSRISNYLGTFVIIILPK